MINMINQLDIYHVYWVTTNVLTLLHSVQPKLYGVLAVLSATGLKENTENYPLSYTFYPFSPGVLNYPKLTDANKMPGY